MRYIAFLAAGLLAGCVSVYDQMNTGLAALVGQDIKIAVNKIGYPDSQREMMGATIYTWAMEHHGAMVLPTVSTTTGSIGGTPYSQNTYGSEVVSTHAQCKIELATDSSGTITRYQWNGNGRGCGRYTRALTH